MEFLRRTVAIWASCSMLASVPAGANQDVLWQGLRQQFGYSQEGGFYDNDLRDFYYATMSKSNTNAWIDQFPAGRGMPTVVVNSRQSITDCWNNSNSNKIFWGTGMSPIGPNGVSCGYIPGPNFACNTWRTN